jgi:carbon monoxide dehydrogenase subunit G
MKFENAFVVQAPIDEVWSTLLDVERVAPCMPGAKVLERDGEDAYKVGIKVKVGPMSMTYRAEVEIAERDDAARVATMRAKAKESRGQGTADAVVKMALAEQPDGTHATLATEVQLSGRAAAMGQGVIADVSARLVETFAENLAQMLVAGPEAAPAAEQAPTQAPTPAPTPPAAPAFTPAVAPPAAPAAVAAAPVPAAAPADASLPVGKLAAGVIAGRLGEPRTLLAAIAALAAVFGAIGYRLGKGR